MNEFVTAGLWVSITLPALIWLQRWIHKHLHGISFLVTGNPHWALVVYALILLPGVFLHELSHWVAAKSLGIRTGRFSIIPQHTPNGVRLGYVEYYTANVGFIRESLVGGAPLIAGTLAVLFIGFSIFDMEMIITTIQTGGAEGLNNSLNQFFQTNDVLVWLYLLFAISNAMLPSPSDTKSWPAFFAMFGVLNGVLWLLGVLDVVLVGLSKVAIGLFGYFGLALSLAIGVDLVVVVFLLLLETFIMRVTQTEIVYGSRP